MAAAEVEGVAQALGLQGAASKVGVIFSINT